MTAPLEHLHASEVADIRIVREWIFRGPTACWMGDYVTQPEAHAALDRLAQSLETMNRLWEEAEESGRELRRFISEEWSE